MSEPVRFRFGSYVIDSQTRTLIADGAILPLQPKPFLLLETLVRRHGEVVSREDLAKVIWPDTHVQVDQGLNAAVKKVRSVLRDDAKSPLYIETLGSRGYRFIFPVEVLGWSQGATPAVGALEPSTQGLKPSSVQEQCVRARYQLTQHTRTSIHRAIHQYNEAVAADPQYAPAYAGLANAYLLLGDMNFVLPQSAYEAARSNAQRALELDPALVDAMVPLAWATLLLDRDWNCAQRWIDRALEINPRHAQAFSVKGLLEMIRGRREQAVALVRHARLLAPLSVFNNVLLAHFLYYSVEFEAATNQALQTLEMNHGSQMMVLPVLCSSLLALGRTREAVVLLSTHLENEAETYPALPALAIALAHAGRTQEAQAVMERSVSDTKNRPPSSFLLSLAHRALGNRELAESYMVRAIHERNPCTFFLAVDPQAQDYMEFIGVRPWMEWLRHQAV
ncbi:MAG TPA: winged helix-turn-helix domain-containing protein [Candidatus Acidoferrales bacterium]|nr:winged helix-turn-helix domain-containing protein [Candidatus Acidoferrales bacterium]